MRLYCITGNLEKAGEIKDVLSKYGVEVVHVDLKLVEIQSDSLEEIAKSSAIEAYEMLKKPLIVEDSGLFVESLGGFPGPFSSYVFKTLGNRGLLKLMKGLKNRKATFKSIIAYCEKGENPTIFTGKALGEIALKERGHHWGFDPIFIPAEGDGRTYAEMGMLEKNKISHRRKALDQLARHLLGKLTR
jgi:XTP/dITP diphosphohydrolase